MGMTAEDFHGKFEKNDMRTLCFGELIFLTKYGHETSVFLENGRFVDKICA